MTPELIAAMFTGFTGLVAALAAFTANRSRRAAADARYVRKRLRRLERWVILASEHMFVLEQRLISAGISVPERPPDLDEMVDDDEDDDPPPSAGPTRPGGTR